MSTFTLETDVRLPYLTVPGGLLAVADPLPDGWENGVTFRGTGCVEPVVLEPCTVIDSTEVRPGDPAVFQPIVIQQSAGCSMLSKIGSRDMAMDRLDSTSEWALGRVLATGAGTDNPSFADASVVIDADNATEAVSCIEQAAANLGFGAEIVLHAPYRAAAYLAEARLNVGGFSPTGARWVISPGYPAETDEVTIWATGSVFAGVGASAPVTNGVTGLVPVGWRHNTDAAYAQRVGLAVFDPCLILSATFTVPACNGGS